MHQHHASTLQTLQRTQQPGQLQQAAVQGLLPHVNRLTVQTSWAPLHPNHGSTAGTLLVVFCGVYAVD